MISFTLPSCHCILYSSPWTTSSSAFATTGRSAHLIVPRQRLCCFYSFPSKLYSSPYSQRWCWAPKSRRYGTTKPGSSNWKRRKRAGWRNRGGKVYKRCSGGSPSGGSRHSPGLRQRQNSKTSGIRCSASFFGIGFYFCNVSISIGRR